MQPTRSSLCLSASSSNRRPQRPPPLRCCQRSASSTTATAPWRRTTSIASTSPRSGNSVIIVPPPAEAVGSRTAAAPSGASSDRACASTTPPEEPQGSGSTSTGSGNSGASGGPAPSRSNNNEGLNDNVLMTPRSSWPRMIVSSPKASKRIEKQEPLPSARFETPADCTRRLEFPGSRGQSVAVEGNRAGRPQTQGGSLPFRPESRLGSNSACVSGGLALQGFASACGTRRTSAPWLLADVPPCGSVCLPTSKPSCHWERRHEQERNATLIQTLQELQVQNKALTEQNRSLRESVATKDSRIRSQEAELQELRATMGRLVYQHLLSGRGETSFKPPAWLYSASSSRDSPEDLELLSGTPTQASLVDAVLA